MEIALEEMSQHAAAAEQLLKQLANRNRLMVLCVLSDGELSVGELNARVPLSQSALSQHLAKLRQAGLVSTRREAQTIYYRMSDPAARRIIAELYLIYCGPGTNTP
jgi:ArsR family transcriptional regulator, virulence genes transcriptional regulator